VIGLAKVTTGSAIGSITPVLRLGGIKGAVPGAYLAKNLFNALIEILKSRLPIHIYLDHNIEDKIGMILDAMGIRYVLRPVEEMKPPYIYIQEVNGKIVVVTADKGEDDPIAVVGSSLSGFLDSFISLFKKRYPWKSKKVLELIGAGSEESVEAEGVGAELESVEAEIGKEAEKDYMSSIEETLMDFENE
jgi:2-phospho-L-lactate transferase/gluconeogenesis factor (CofD/UPF0052 family)